MKKLTFIFAAIVMAAGLSACSAKNDTSSAASNSADNQNNLKVAMVKLYSTLSTTINSKDADLNAYEKSDSPDPALKTKASDSALAVAAALKTVRIPSELKAYDKELEGSLNDLAESYQMKADELKKNQPSLNAANAKFTKGQNELGDVFVKVKLGKPDLSKEVN